ncbi:MAG TPA: hypothetical protein VLA19_26230 [Herpetosiphonaceae bacterium]|nr:hypothetical protein [Herpetosiphonaceae bacterium]
MNTYDDVKAFALDRCTDMRQDAEQLHQGALIKSWRRTESKLPALHGSGMLVVFAMLRSIMGKIAHAAARA